MLSDRICRAAHTAALACSFVFIFAIVALADDRRQNAPGEFDFDVLALSWSPTFCESSKNARPTGPIRSAMGGPLPSSCMGCGRNTSRASRPTARCRHKKLDRATVGSALDLMPSPRLVFREWDRHGTCSGLTPHAYFEAVRKARAVVKIPSGYLAPAEPLSVSPDDVAAAFVKANPGLPRTAVAIACDATRLTEVRVCMAKDFTFHDCADVTSHACKRDKIAMPAVHAELNGMK